MQQPWSRQSYERLLPASQSRHRITTTGFERPFTSPSNTAKSWCHWSTFIKYRWILADELRQRTSHSTESIARLQLPQKAFPKVETVEYLPSQ